MAKGERSIAPLSPEALGYLRAIRVAADDSCASDAEAQALSVVFQQACVRHGLDTETMAVAIEVLL